jgi:integrase
MALYKRGTIWWMSFQHEHRHFQKSTGCKNKRDAEAYERAYRTKLAMGEVGFTEKKNFPNFTEAVREFLEWSAIEHQGKPNTVRSYVNSSASPLRFFGDTPLNAIQADDVERFKVWRSTERTKPRRVVKKLRQPKSDWKPTPLKPATVNRELALLKMLFNYYVRRDVLVKNPVSQVKLLSEEKNHTRVVTVAEEAKYLMAASQPLQDFATVMVDTGMRPDEVANIEMRNVNVEQNFILVPVGKTKSARRKIPMTQRVRDLISRRIRDVRNEFLFSSDSTPNPITTLKTAHSGALRRSGVDHFRLYDLRHTFATRFLESGGDLITLQAILGHSTISMVTRYAHPSEKHQFEAMLRMEEQVRGRYDSEHSHKAAVGS